MSNNQANEPKLLTEPSRFTPEFLPPEEAFQEYIPLDPDYLSPDKACSFPLYMYHPAKKRFVLFKSENAPITTEQVTMLSKDGKRPLFVPHENSFELQRYMSESLGLIITSPNLPVEQKAQQFHQVASTVMQSLFELPPDNKEFISTAKNVSDSLSNLLTSEPQAMRKLNQLRSYDYYTFSHSMNVCVLSVGLYKHLEPALPENQVTTFTRGVLLHDIGKCDIPTRLTTKKGPLTEDEWLIMKSHTEKGFKRLTDDDELSDEDRYISLFHHEAIDGSGYPNGLTKDEIPYTSRICKVVDVFDALTSKRSYKSKMSAFEALQLMSTEMNNKIDQDMLKEFIMFLHKMGKLR